MLGAVPIILSIAMAVTFARQLQFSTLVWRKLAPGTFDVIIVPISLLALGLGVILIPAVIQFVRGWRLPAGNQPEFDTEQHASNGGVTVEDVQNQIQKRVGLVLSKLAKEAIQDRKVGPRHANASVAISVLATGDRTTPGSGFTSP